MTAEVIAHPKKYGQEEIEIRALVKNLLINLSDDSKLEGINSECLSLTYENMRADTLDDLFKRIGAKGVWDILGQQARIMALFETRDGVQARKDARNLLNTFMDIRNNIAHPSPSVTFPDSVQVTKYIEFFDILGSAISDVTKVFESSLSPKNNRSTKETAAT